MSNISFGQPSRSIINQAFASLAIGAGMDSAIMDPCDTDLRGMIYAAEMVLGLDPDCQAYGRAHRQGLLGTAAGISSQHLKSIGQSASNLLSALKRAGLVETGERMAESFAVSAAEDGAHHQHKPGGHEAVMEDLVSCLVNMKRDRVAELTDKLLDGGADPMALLDASRRGMAEVGRLFEQEEYFVPELLLAGRMLSTISEKVKPYLIKGKSTEEKKGRVIIGTVEGDIHDIGKDIVVTMLDISGYEVLDLGVDVPKERFLEAAAAFKPQVIGLSGFLTLVFDPMKDTIAALKRADIGEVRFMIGGGQIDEQVLEYTGADAYGRNALEAVKLCDKWIC
jgi:5-methyltetrahydrofolate--homocysteine methyltransferase